MEKIFLFFSFSPFVVHEIKPILPYKLSINNGTLLVPEIALAKSNLSDLNLMETDELSQSNDDEKLNKLARAYPSVTLY